MYGYIYKVTNLITGKIYVGKKKSEVFLGEEYLGSGTIIRKSIDKHGKENFMVELLDQAETKDDLNAKEKYWIAHLNCLDPKIGYNIAEGGDGGILWKPGEHPSLGKHREGLKGPKNGMFGKKRSKESCEAQSAQLKKHWEDHPKFRIIKDGQIKYATNETFPQFEKEGWKKQKKEKRPKIPYHHTDEAKAKISAASKGRKHSLADIEAFKKTMASKSPEELALISKHKSDSHKGKLQSEETKKKRSETMKRKYAEGEVKICPYIGSWNKGREESAELRLQKSLKAKGKIWINNGIESKMIHPEAFKEYQEEGYIKGRLTFKRTKK